jgi:CheY-like chemotaxis protein
MPGRGWSAVHRQVLLVDDEPALLKSLAPFLEFAGHQVVTAADAQAALELLQSSRPDAIVCDLHLPGIDGFEFYRRVRQNREWRTIRFIFLTGAAQETGLRQSLQLTDSRCLTKPLDPDDLLTILSEDGISAPGA